MAKFEEAYQLTSIQEGGYSNHSKDKGGETYHGIARKHWPVWAGWEMIDEVKNERSSHLSEVLASNKELQVLIESFYKENFWNKLLCDHLPQKVANELFDTSVNMGHYYGAYCLQKSLNKLNRNQKDYKDILVDGQIGVQTLKATSSLFKTANFSSRNHDKILKWLLKWMNYYQLRKYDLITEKNPDQEVFIAGWTTRS